MSKNKSKKKKKSKGGKLLMFEKGVLVVHKKKHIRFLDNHPCNIDGKK